MRKWKSSPPGAKVWVRTIGEAVKDDTGKIIKVHGAFQDITERKRWNLNCGQVRSTSSFF